MCRRSKTSALGSVMPASITGCLQAQCCWLCSLTACVVGCEPSAAGWHQAGRDGWLEGSSARHSRNSTQTSGKSCVWDRITPCSSLAWQPRRAKAALQKMSSGEEGGEEEPMCPRSQGRLAACLRNSIWSTRSSLGISRPRKALRSLSKQSWDRQDGVCEERLKQLALKSWRREGG